MALLFVDPSDEVGREVDDLLELLGLEFFLRLDAGEEVGQPRAGAAQVPDVYDGGGEFDVAHAVTTHLRAGDFNTATLADDALETDPLVLTAVALPVTGGAEDLLAEQTVFFGTQCAVVDRFGLLDFTVRPVTDVVGCRQPNFELLEHVDVEHGRPLFRLSRACYQPMGGQQIQLLCSLRSAAASASWPGGSNRSVGPQVGAPHVTSVARANPGIAPGNATGTGGRIQRLRGPDQHHTGRN